MSESHNKGELRNIENKLISRYSRLSIIFLFTAILLIIIVAIVFLGIIFLEYGYNWAGLDLEGWIILVSALFGVFILLELIFFLHVSSIRNKITGGKPKPEFINGKKVIIFTHPTGTEGGIFSKTYIDLDENSVLRLRSLMIPPEELWK